MRPYKLSVCCHPQPGRSHHTHIIEEMHARTHIFYFCVIKLIIVQYSCFVMAVVMFFRFAQSALSSFKVFFVVVVVVGRGADAASDSECVCVCVCSLWLHLLFCMPVSALYRCAVLCAEEPLFMLFVLRSTTDETPPVSVHSGKAMHKIHSTQLPPPPSPLRLPPLKHQEQS